jgi:hypothetical protein
MNAVATRVAANWTHTPISDINGSGDVPSDNSAFLELLFPIATEEPLSFGATGSNAQEESGAFRVCLYVPAGIGLNPVATPWQTRIETLMAAFRAARFSAIDCVGFVGPTVRPESERGSYFEISFAVSYRRIFAG